MNNRVFVDYLRDILDKWLKKESLAFVEKRKAEGAILTEKEEHISKRSFEAGVLKGLAFSVDMQPKYKDFISRMNDDLLKDIK